MALLVKIITYLLRFILVGIFYALYSYLFDLLFFRLDYGSISEYKASPLEYLIFFCVAYIFLSLPGFVFYDLLINGFDNKKNRIIFGFVFGLFLGFFINRAGYSYYIGDLRGIKSGITLAMTLLSFELIRDIISKKDNN